MIIMNKFKVNIKIFEKEELSIGIRSKMGLSFFLFKKRIPDTNIFFQLFLSIHEVKFRVKINIIIFLKRNSYY